MINKIRGGMRLFLFSIHSFCALFRVMFAHRTGKLTLAKGLDIRQKWASRMLPLLNFHVDWRGDFPQDEPCLFVGNHRSSLDPIVMLARLRAFPVSRAEVRKWPAVGKGSDMTGIIFVDKSSRESRKRVRILLLEQLQKGNSVLIFPEGRTNVDPLTATFQKGSFEQAAQGPFKVIPFVLEYKDKGAYWDHTDNFAVHFLKEFGKRRTDIRVVFGPPIISETAWTLLRKSQEWIDNTIVDIRKEWDTE